MRFLFDLFRRLLHHSHWQVSTAERSPGRFASLVPPGQAPLGKNYLGHAVTRRSRNEFYPQEFTQVTLSFALLHSCLATADKQGSLSVPHQAYPAHTSGSPSKIDSFPAYPLSFALLRSGLASADKQGSGKQATTNLTPLTSVTRPP